MSVNVYKEIEVEVDIEDFDDAELVDEIDRRKLYASSGSVIAINQIADAFALKKHDQAMRMLENLIYDVTGRIVPLI
jgi:hypothetical protein